MKRLYSLALCFLLILAFLLPANAAGVPRRVMEATKSVVRILAERPRNSTTGTGFVIKNEPGEVLVVTNNHVVEDKPTRIAIWVGEEEMVEAEILFTYPDKDLCVLLVTEEMDMEPLTLSETDPEHGAAIYAAGYPGASDALYESEAHTSESVTVTDGIISAIRTMTIEKGADPVKLLQINAAINYGNSGGPLFNAKGEVVGVNTFLVTGNDAQGVFGSVAISELWTLLDQHDIVLVEETEPTEVPTEAPAPAPEPEPVLPVKELIMGSVAVIVLAAIIAMIVLLKRRGIPLRRYMEKYPRGMESRQAVSLLMPLILQLRDLHNSGKLHLQIAPHSIRISGKRAVLRTPTKKESDRNTSGFAAPEVYKAMECRASADVYSLGAMLLYLTMGRVPANSLQPEQLSREIAMLETLEPELGSVVRSCMRQDESQRFQSVQAVIYALSSYNDQRFLGETLPAERPVKQKKTREKKERQPKKSKFRWALPVLAVLVLIPVTVALLWKPYVQPKIDAKEEAERIANAYQQAVSLMDQGQYEAAMEAFEMLDGYEDSESRITQCQTAIENAILEEQYQAAAALEEEGKFGHAGLAFYRLGEYQDSRERSFAAWSRIRRKDPIVHGGGYQNYHFMGIRNDGTVLYSGTNPQGLRSTKEWENITQVIIMDHGAAAGLQENGRVVTVPIGADWMLQAENWRDIVHLYECGYKGVAGLKRDGTVVCAVEDRFDTSVIESWTEIVDMALYNGDLIALRADGTICVSGYLEKYFTKSVLQQWTDIVAISTNCGFWAMKEDGTILRIDWDGEITRYENAVALCGGMLLKPDGTVEIFEDAYRNDVGPEAVAHWKDIVQIWYSWNGYHGLTSDGTVVSTDPFFKEDWTDIVFMLYESYYQAVGVHSDGSVEVSFYILKEMESWTDIRIP